MRRFRVGGRTFNVTVRLPDDLNTPVNVEVRAHDSEGELRIARLRWRREWTDEQRSGSHWKDELPPFAAAELIIAACGGAVPDSVEVIEPLPHDDFEDPRRLLEVAIASATIEASCTGQEAKIVLHDLSASREG